MAQALITVDETEKIRQHEVEPAHVAGANDSLPLSEPQFNLNRQVAQPSGYRIHGDGQPNLGPAADQPTVFYLAYGSNLAAATFRGRRGIRPLSAVNVVVPSLRLSFDLPGIAYSEPCFANSATREGYPPPGKGEDTASEDDKHPKPPSKPQPPYHKDRWYKGMVGVAYELTAADYAHVIATEGAGVSYQDVVVDCFVLPKGVDTVPDKTDGEPLRVHTLFAPPKSSPGDGGRLTRPDPSYAQPSARYLKLLTDGAAENDLPKDYREYLAQIRPYRVTTQGQRLGRWIFLSIWRPVIMTLFMLFAMFNDENGRAPPWLVQLGAALFTAAWASYDSLFKQAFGDGERTINEEPDLCEHLHGGEAPQSYVHEKTELLDAV